MLMVSGYSGTGKTTWAAKSPTPFHVLFEPQGLPSVAMANPDAEVVVIRKYEDALNVLQALRCGAQTELNGQPAFKFKLGGRTTKPVVCQTVVIDSLTELQEMALEHYSRGSARPDFAVWGQVQGDIKSALSDLRTLPVNVVCLTLLNDSTDDNGALLKCEPALYGKAKAFAPRYFSGVGVATKKRSKSKGTVYSIHWDADARFVTKKPPAPAGVDFPAKTTGTLGSILSLLYPGVNVAKSLADSPDKAA